VRPAGRTTLRLSTLTLLHLGSAASFSLTDQRAINKLDGMPENTAKRINRCRAHLCHPLPAG
jgi:hypothetical protein